MIKQSIQHKLSSKAYLNIYTHIYLLTIISYEYIVVVNLIFVIRFDEILYFNIEKPISKILKQNLRHRKI